MSLTIGSNRHDVGAGFHGAEVTATRLSWLVAALALVASVTGVLVEDVYTGPAATAEMFRAYDLVTAVVVVPGLAVAAYLARGGSVLASLAIASLEATLVYSYAYYVFGTGFNDLFLLHVAVLTAGLGAFVFSLATLDVAGVASHFGPRTPVRTIATLLGLLAAALGGMWLCLAVDNAITGDVPAGSRLVETDTVVRLGIALDLTLLVPLYAVAAVLLWRRERWGYVLAAIALFAGLVHQIGYLVAMPFQVAADIPGAVSYDPGEPAVLLAYVVATALLLYGARDGRAEGRAS
jgi:hypothetical protein